VAKRCIAKTLTGQRCPFSALDGSNYCGIHGPATTKSPRLAMKKAARKALKKAVRKVAGKSVRKAAKKAARRR
jgi:hypothetical protein